MGEVRPENDHKRGFPLTQTPEDFNCQPWVFHDYVKSKNFVLEDLIAKHDLRNYNVDPHLGIKIWDCCTCIPS